MSFPTILYPTDFSRHSRAALRFATTLAKQQGGKLLIAHVAHPAEPPTVVAGAGIGTYPVTGVMAPMPDEATNVAHQTIEQHLTELKPTEDIPYEHRLLEGTPADEIVRLANEAEATQIVMGSHGRRGLSRVLMGSVAESVLRQAECPVTIVKADVADLQEET